MRARIFFFRSQLPVRSPLDASPADNLIARADFAFDLLGTAV